MTERAVGVVYEKIKAALYGRLSGLEMYKIGKNPVRI